jgi:nucleoside-diphosphate-sugar epimerase
MRAAASAGVRRAVHISTTDVYAFPGAGPVTESHVPTRFANWYAQTKLEAEREVRAAASEAPLASVILRPATVYGPGSTDVIGEIARAIRGGHMLLVDRGRAVAGLCYVENLVDAVLIALRHKDAPGEAFNVTDGLPTTWRELCDDLAEGMRARRVRWSIPYRPAHALGLALEGTYRLLRRSTGVQLAPLLSRQAVQVLGRDQHFSNLKLRHTLGWEPRVGYAQGLRATLEWLASEHR